MKYQATGVAAFAAVAAAFSPAVDHGHEADHCPTDAITVYPTAVVYPLAISTYIAADTVFNINGNANITINNAPTTIETIIQATTTVFNTVTTTVTTGSQASATGTNTDADIILAVNGAVLKRQATDTGKYYNGYGTVEGCSGAARLRIRNGQLFDSNNFQYSTSSDFSSDYFTSSGSVRSISTTFATDNGFSWFNAAFTNGQASFCQDTTGGIRAIFQGSAPIGCTTISFTAFAASSCVSNTTSSASTTGSSSTSMSSSASMSESSMSESSMSSTTSESGSATSTSSSGSGTLTPTISISSLSLSTTGTSTTGSSGTGTSTSTSTTATSTNTATPAIPTDLPAGADPVVVQFNVPGLAKRQNGGVRYLRADGTFTANKAEAVVLGFLDDMLYAGPTPFSTDGQTDNEVFVATDPASDITTTFSITGGLTWTNSAFTIQGNGQAQFAVVGDTIYVAFLSLPAGATVVTASASPLPTTASSSASASSTSASASTVTGSAVSSSRTGSSSSGSASTAGSSSTAAPTSSTPTSSSTSSRSDPTASAGLKIRGWDNVKRYNVPHARVRHA